MVGNRPGIRGRVPAPFFPRAWIAFSFALLVVAGAASASEPWREESLWTKKLKIGILNEPFCGDFDFDGRVEILVTSREGEGALLDAGTGDEIWSRKVKGGLLLSPLIGQFVYMTAFPIRGLVTVLQANIRNLAVVLGQVAQNKA